MIRHMPLASRLLKRITKLRLEIVGMVNQMCLRRPFVSTGETALVRNYYFSRGNRHLRFLASISVFWDQFFFIKYEITVSYSEIRLVDF